ncbi:hypothetical protein [Okeania sp.]|uniref:hypothetical protein n=1 Tax=Okeania sp. TaxID=3100323 RepID=UPI002B4B2063|nr:hypothetical protein [Okeania sp.]
MSPQAPKTQPNNSVHGFSPDKIRFNCRSYRRQETRSSIDISRKEGVRSRESGVGEKNR